jgi:hypothetical protein
MKPVFTFLLVIILGATGSLAQKPDNSIRIESLVYVMPDKATGEFNKIIQPFDGFELLAFDSTWGRMKPRAVFRNLTQNNYINFTVCVNILDPETNQYVYNHELFIGSAALMDGKKSGVRLFDSTGRVLYAHKNVPPGARVEVTFKEFFPNEKYVYTDGCLRLMAFSKYNDINTADDTLSFCVETIVSKAGFSIEYKLSNDSTNKKSTINWINRGVEVVNAWDYVDFNNNGYAGEFYSIPPPNDDDSMPGYLKLWQVEAPACKLNRVDLSNNEYSTSKPDGDFIISQIFDITKNKNLALKIDYLNKPLNNINFDRGNANNILKGPEHRIINNNTQSDLIIPDNLTIEFICADKDNIFRLLNPNEKDWNSSPGSKELYSSPPYVLPGGSYMNANIKNMYMNPFDITKNSFFNTASIIIPDTILDKKVFIRIRVKVNASNHSNDLFADDLDDFIIKQLYFMRYNDSEMADIFPYEINLNYPYSSIPLNNLDTVILSVKVVNNTEIACPSFRSDVFLCIGKEAYFDLFVSPWWIYSGENTFFSRIYHPFMKPNDTIRTDYKISMKRFSTIKEGINNIHVYTSVRGPGGDLNERNDYLYGKFNIYVDKSIGYDDPVNVVNDVPEFSGVPGSGLNLLASSNGTDDYSNCYGYPDGNGSGQIAVRFRLDSRDTVFGYQAFFAENVQTNEDVRFCIYKDTNSMNYPIGYEIPYQLVPGSEIYRKKGLDDFTNELKLNQYVTYLYEKPVVLDAGTYWAAIGQTGKEGLNLGGSKYRMGMATTVYDSAGKGKNGVTVMLNNAFNSGVNENVFAYQNIIDKGKWVPFMPTKGNPAFSYLDHAGTITKDEESYRTFQRGTFAPMLRIYMDGSHYKPVSVIETDRQSESGYLHVSPNPAGDYIEINLDRCPTSARCWTSDNIQIYNSIGECVMTDAANVKTLHATSLRIDTSELPPGIYFLHYSGQYVKFVKM